MDIQKILEKAFELFGKLPEPDVYPKQFAYLLKLAKYELDIKSKSVV